MRLSYAAFLVVAAGIAHAQSTPPNPAKLYAVIFDVTVNAAGQVQTLKVANVIDPESGRP
jgi:hypothetical protein